LVCWAGSLLVAEWPGTSWSAWSESAGWRRYSARDERLGRVVALKLLTGDEPVRRRFVREARAIAAVDHPHIIPVYEADEAAGVLFIAIRFVVGDHLRVVVGQEGGLPPRRAAAFISSVASALDAAPAAGLVHRDVKPANMLVDVGPVSRSMCASRISGWPGACCRRAGWPGPGNSLAHLITRRRSRSAVNS